MTNEQKCLDCNKSKSIIVIGCHEPSLRTSDLNKIAKLLEPIPKSLTKRQKTLNKLAKIFG